MAASQCAKCGGVLKRSRRGFAQRLLYSEILRCDGCGKKRKTFLFSFKNIRYVKCPRCHSMDLTVLKRRDGIDRMHRSVGGFFHQLLGGKLYHCWFCRLQFYDLRPRLALKGKTTSRPLGEEPDSGVELAS